MRLPFAALLLASFSTTTVGGDWPQWMGPNRDAVWSEGNVAEHFKNSPPKEKWRVAVGGGYSGPAVVADRIYLTDKMLKPGLVAPKNPFDAPDLESTARLLCLDAATGAILWRHERPVTYRIQYSCGPRCTPLVHEGKVYSLGAMGHLDCFDAGKETDGRATPLWSKNFVTDFGAKVPTWGFSGHPILHKNLLICLVGGEKGAVYALDKQTGAVVWSALSASEPGYNSPVLIESGGVTQLVVWLPNQLAGLDPLTGAKHWSVKLEPQYAMSIMSPRKDGEHLFAAGIGNVGVTLRLDANNPKKVSEVWRGNGEPDPKDGVYPVNMTPFIEAGTVYSADQPGTFRAVDLKTGARKWDSFKPIFGEEKPADFKAPAATAFIVKNSTNNLFYLFSETGDLVIAKLTPKGYDELGRVHLLDPMCTALNGRKAVWSHPAFANRSVYARNDKHLVCVPLGK